MAEARGFMGRFANWGFEYGRIQNNEAQFYTNNHPENAQIENGNLVIEARRENYKSAAYTSASLLTLGKHSMRLIGNSRILSPLVCDYESRAFRLDR